MAMHVFLWRHKNVCVLGFKMRVHVLVQAKRICQVGTEWLCTAQGSAALFGSSSSCLRSQQVNDSNDGLCYNVLVNHCPHDKLLQKMDQV